VSISGLTPVATTYNKICLQANLIDSGGTPYLLDWTASWSAGINISGTVWTNEAKTTNIASIKPYIFL